MPIQRVSIAVIVALSVLSGLFWLVGAGQPAAALTAAPTVAPASPAAELRVCHDGCTYASVQAAVDAAQPGDVIKVAQGVYTDVHVRAGITQVVYISKSLTLRGGYTTTDWAASDPAAHPTTLDARGKARVLVAAGSGVELTAEGLRITGGHTPEPLIRGGGVYVDQAGGVISGCVIYSNTAAYYGGGLAMILGSMRLSHNTFLSNTADVGVGQGGGLYLVGVTSRIAHNTIQGNAALEGGGLNIFGSGLTLEDNLIAGNTAGHGGGLQLVLSQGDLLSRNVIRGNTASRGGGVLVYASTPTLVNNVVMANEGTYRGAGIYVTSAATAEVSVARLLHTTLVGNTGGQYGDGSGVCVVDEGGGGHSTVAMTNTLWVDHTVGITVSAGNTATLNASLWHANGTDRGGAGLIDHLNDHTGDPVFAADGYHLAGKPGAIDKGVNAGVTTDIDGDARPRGAGYDLGADETALRHYSYLPISLLGSPTQLALAAQPAGVASELRVCSSGCAYSSIQAAVDAAQPGDVIKVAQGTYTDVHVRAGITQVVYISKSLTLRGGYNPPNWTTPDPAAYPTVLDAGGQGRGLVATGYFAVAVEGVLITGGDANGLGGFSGGMWDAGGGVYLNEVTATLSECVVISNTATTGNRGWGGGVLIQHGTLILNGSRVLGNVASSGFGGMGGGVSVYLGSATLSDNELMSNTASSDGGGLMANYSQISLDRNHIAYNTAASSGGGFRIVGGATDLNANLILENDARYGAGGYLWGGDVTWVNNVVADNVAEAGEGIGAGIGIFNASSHFIHTTFARNRGGDGSAVHIIEGQPSTAFFTNTVIVSHTVGVTVTAGTTARLNATLWQANDTDWGGAGTIHRSNDYTGDPALAADGYHLTAGSAALDRGVNAGVSTDIDDQERPQGAGYDLGADELPAAPPDILWEKRVRVGDGAFRAWDQGPFTVAPGETVTIVERVWVTATDIVSFTLAEAWTRSLDWLSGQASVGDVTAAGRSATWHAADADETVWHVLTQTLRAVATADYADVLTETLTVDGMSPQLPTRVVRFQQPRPQPVWEKTVQVGDGAPRAWDAGRIPVQPGDTLTVVDRVWITHTASVTFTLAQTWGPALTLRGQAADVGTVTPGTAALSWQGDGVAPHRWHALTSTLRVSDTTWALTAITETLSVADAASQFPQRRIELLNGSGADCYVRVNDGATEYTTVQDGIDAAQAGDVVKVAGRCSSVNGRGGLAQIAFLTQSLTLRGGYTRTNWTTSYPLTQPTTLDARGLGRGLYVVGDITPTVEGLRITGGDASGLGGTPYTDVDGGGGVYVAAASAIISGSRIEGNVADRGGGLWLQDCTATLRHSVVHANTATSAGGGMWVHRSPALLWANTVSSNTALYSGGIMLYESDATVRGNAIISNTATASEGGGISVVQSPATLEGNVIRANWVDEAGGGLHLTLSDATLVNNVIVDNHARRLGSGIYIRGASPHLVHTTLARNTGAGGGLYAAASVAGDVFSHVRLTNTVVVSHGVAIFAEITNSVTLHATLWHANAVTATDQGLVRATANYDGDPAFAADGYHLTGPSVALDRGVDAGVATDIDGEVRPRGRTYDLGADEHPVLSVYLPVLMKP